MPDGVKTVFIGWAGPIGKKVAVSLSDRLLNTPTVRGWVSATDIEHSQEWLVQLEEVLRTADHAIVCLTPSSAEAPWINFEAGITYGRLKKLTVLKVGEDIPPDHPFKAIQALDGRELADIKRLMRTLIPENKEFAETWAETRGPQWIKDCDEILAPILAFPSINAALRSIQGAARKLQANAGIFANPLFRFVLERSFDSISKQLEGVVTSYSVPSSLYPAYLGDLQGTLKPIVRAVALVEQEEFFWRGSLGKRVLDTIPNKECERVFVLTSEHQLIEFMPILQMHAHRYSVYVLPYTLLRNELPEFCKDFSIIQIVNAKVLATYIDHGVNERDIQFSIDPGKLGSFEAGFDQIRSLAKRVEDIQYSQEEISQWWDSIPMTDFQRKNVEMSTYIPIHSYDEHEEKHAYFKEMMQKMIDLLLKSKRDGPLRVLEFGAGTGLFTRRLAALPEVCGITAVEYDWACFEALRHNVRQWKDKVKIEYKDSRIFNPPGTFDAVVSSFADHHIRKADKDRYLANVLRNLRSGAPFIVGDEFLSEHNTTSDIERDDALRRYHEHIIKIAQDEKEFILADLEQAALESGLQRLGDFKVSCGSYERLLDRNKFNFTKYCIGPSEPNNIGGVYVYLCRPVASGDVS